MHLIQRSLRQIKMVSIYMLRMPVPMSLMRLAVAHSRVALRPLIPCVPVPVVFRHSTKLTRLQHPLTTPPQYALTIAL